MMKDFETLEISIPADSDGYVLLKCHLVERDLCFL